MRTGWLLIVLLVGTARVLAQQADVRVSTGPHYVDMPIDIQVIVDGFERSPEPTIDVDVPEGMVINLVGVSPNISSSIQIINGRMTRDERVRFVYRYQLLAQTQGHLELVPFRVAQGAATAVAPGIRFQIQPVPTTDDQRLRLVLPEGPLWVGQRVPVTLEWWLTESFAERLAGRRARVPLFDHVDRFAFEDKPLPQARTKLTVETVAGTMELPVTVRTDEWRGKPYLVVSAERIMIALKAGEITIEPASIVTEEAIRWSRDFFGNRIPASVRRLRVEDEARTLVFTMPPVEGRRASFSGAVGKGFTLAASADRSVVQTGDPIRLTLEVRGDTALETVSLPRLADSGLDRRDFKTPAGPVAGIVEDGVKRFEVVVRVSHDQVREIPSIELSWFNPELGRYETTRSRPIAVSVRGATVVSAADVVRSQAPGHGAEIGDRTDADLAPEPFSVADARNRPAFTLSGAELAIETRPAILARSPVPWYGRPAALGIMYLSAAVGLGLAVAARRRASVDPAMRERRRKLEAEHRVVARTGAVGDLARALRRMAAASPTLPREAYESLLVECDNLAFAPSAGDNALVDERLRARALVVADAILEAAR